MVTATKMFGGWVAAVFLATHVVFAHAGEVSYWAERRASSQALLSDSAHRRGLSPSGPSGCSSPQITSSSPVSSSLSTTAAASLSAEGRDRTKKFFQALSTINGTIRRVTDPRTDVDRTVLHILDVHANAEVQTRIGATVSDVAKKAGVDLVCLEGAFAPIDVEKLRGIKDRAAVESAADAVLREGMISGPVHAAITGPSLHLTGVDDRSHYDRNVAAYRDTRAEAFELREELNGERERLRHRKSTTYSPALRAFDDLAIAYRERRLSLRDYLAALRPAADSPAGRLLLAFAAEKSLDKETVDSQRRALLKTLTERLSPSRLDGLTLDSQALRTGGIRYGEFFQRLSDLCRDAGISLDDFPAMGEYVRYVLMTDRIDTEDLMDQLTVLERERYAALATSPAEKDLVARWRALQLRSGLLEFSLTPSEWREYEVLSASRGWVDARRLEAFYREAHARDRALAENTLKAMEERHASAAVLVTGGFHASGVTDILRKAGVTVISFVPRVEEGEGSEYLSLFSQEKTPLEKLFSGQKLTVSPSPATTATLLGLIPALAAGKVAIERGIIEGRSTLRSFPGMALSSVKERVARILLRRKGTRGTVELAVRRDAGRTYFSQRVVALGVLGVLSIALKPFLETAVTTTSAAGISVAGVLLPTMAMGAVLLLIPRSLGRWSRTFRTLAAPLMAAILLTSPPAHTPAMARDEAVNGNYSEFEDYTAGNPTMDDDVRGILDDFDQSDLRNNLPIWASRYNSETSPEDKQKWAHLILGGIERLADLEKNQGDHNDVASSNQNLAVVRSLQNSLAGSEIIDDIFFRASVFELRLAKKQGRKDIVDFYLTAVDQFRKFHPQVTENTLSGVYDFLIDAIDSLVQSTVLDSLPSKERDEAIKLFDAFIDRSFTPLEKYYADKVPDLKKRLKDKIANALPPLPTVRDTSPHGESAPPTVAPKSEDSNTTGAPGSNPLAGSSPRQMTAPEVEESNLFDIMKWPTVAGLLGLVWWKRGDKKASEPKHASWVHPEFSLWGLPIGRFYTRWLAGGVETLVLLEVARYTVFQTAYYLQYFEIIPFQTSLLVALISMMEFYYGHLFFNPRAINSSTVFRMTWLTFVVGLLAPMPDWVFDVAVALLAIHHYDTSDDKKKGWPSLGRFIVFLGGLTALLGAPAVDRLRGDAVDFLYWAQSIDPILFFVCAFSLLLIAITVIVQPRAENVEKIFKFRAFNLLLTIGTPLLLALGATNHAGVMENTMWAIAPPEGHSAPAYDLGKRENIESYVRKNFVPSSAIAIDEMYGNGTRIVALSAEWGDTRQVRFVRDVIERVNRFIPIQRDEDDSRNKFPDGRLKPNKERRITTLMLQVSKDFQPFLDNLANGDNIRPWPAMMFPGRTLESRKAIEQMLIEAKIKGAQILAVGPSLDPKKQDPQTPETVMATEILRAIEAHPDTNVLFVGNFNTVAAGKNIDGVDGSVSRTLGAILRQKISHVPSVSLVVQWPEDRLGFDLGPEASKNQAANGPVGIRFSPRDYSAMARNPLLLGPGNYPTHRFNGANLIVVHPSIGTTPPPSPAGPTRFTGLIALGALGFLPHSAWAAVEGDPSTAHGLLAAVVTAVIAGALFIGRTFLKGRTDRRSWDGAMSQPSERRSEVLLPPDRLPADYDGRIPVAPDFIRRMAENAGWRGWAYRWGYRSGGWLRSPTVPSPVQVLHESFTGGATPRERSSPVLLEMTVETVGDVETARSLLLSLTRINATLHGDEPKFFLSLTPATKDIADLLSPLISNQGAVYVKRFATFEPNGVPFDRYLEEFKNALRTFGHDISHLRVVMLNRPPLTNVPELRGDDPVQNAIVAAINILVSMPLIRTRTIETFAKAAAFAAVNA